jgi:hypothetical protein
MKLKEEGEREREIFCANRGHKRSLEGSLKLNLKPRLGREACCKESDNRFCTQMKKITDMLKTTGVLCEGFCVEFKPVKGCEQTGVA